MRRFVTSLVLIAVLASSGCAFFNKPTTRPLFVKFDVGCLTAVQAIALVEKDLSSLNLLTPAQALAVRKAMTPVIDLGAKATDALIAWKPGDTTPAVLLELSIKLTDLTNTIVGMLPDGDAKAKLLTAVTLAQSAWASIMQALALQGGGA